MIPNKAKAILDFISGPESKGNYDAYFRHGDNKQVLGVDLGGVLFFQNRMVHVLKLPSSALGRYQFLGATLLGLMHQLHLPLSTPWSNDLQDTLGFQLLRNRGYDAWLAGHMSTSAFADSLSKEWASMPYRTGSSYYDHDGLNKSLVGRVEFLRVLEGARRLEG